MTAPKSTRDKINKAREALGWSYAELARQSGVSSATVRKYLKGQLDTTTEKADAMWAAIKKHRKD